MRLAFRTREGFVGRPVLVLMIVGVFAVWAFYKGYLQWKGPRPAKVAESIKDDVSDSVKKLTR